MTTAWKHMFYYRLKIIHQYILIFITNQNTTNQTRKITKYQTQKRHGLLFYLYYKYMYTHSSPTYTPGYTSSIARLGIMYRPPEGAVIMSFNSSTVQWGVGGFFLSIAPAIESFDL